MKQVRLFLALLQWLTISLLCGAALILSGAYLYLAPNLPQTESLREVKFQTPLKVFSADHKLIAEFGKIRRIPLSYNDTPSQLVNAILAAEDDQFFQHPGISIKALVRAAVDLIRTGSIKSGGSTITMQVAKNFFLSKERTFKRKFNEILLALEIESDLNKEEILALYLNKIFLGHRAYGFGAAAQVYYGKDVSQLSLAQHAMLASLPKAPSKANPISNPKRALERRDWILQRMLNLGYIQPAAFEQAIQEPVSAKNHGLKSELNAPYIAEMVRSQLLEQYGQALYSDGYIVTTTIQSDNQNFARNAVRKGLTDYDQRHGYRGAVRQLSVDEYTSQDELIDALENIPQNAEIMAAIVFDIGPDFASALLKNGSVIYLDHESIAWARAFISVNRQGPAPEFISDTLSVGDIIHVTESNRTQEIENEHSTDGHPPLELPLWNLTQIPLAQGALISLNPNDGAIVSLIGGFSFNLSNFNRATQADRQPGSNFKPFIYSSALHSGFTPASMINDAPVVFNDSKLETSWRPENSSGKFYGPTRLRQALYKSRNLVSIRLLRKVGIGNTIRYVKNFGFDPEKLPTDLSLALGSATLTPIEIARGYAVIANGGYLVDPYLISKIENTDGELIFYARPPTVCKACPQPSDEDPKAAQDNKSAPQEEEFNLAEAAVLQSLPASFDEMEEPDQARNEPEPTQEPLPLAPQVMTPQVNYLIINMMQDVIRKGTGRRALKLRRNDIAGKTGTTNDQKDAWFSGFNPNLTTTTWVGFDNPSTLGAREYGGTAALPIWIDYMGKALKNTPDLPASQPDGLVTLRINPETGLAAAPGEKNAIFEIFREQYAPARIVQSKQSAASDEGGDEQQTIF